MRNQALTGYLLHHRPYQDKRALYYMFTERFGVVHGIGKRGLPLFESLQLFASGKRTLKSFSQVQLSASQPPIRGSQQYAALYLNEILYRLLPIEDPFPSLWAQYEASLNALRQPLAANELKLCLRAFEHSLFSALGYEILFSHDSSALPIDIHKFYRYVPDSGFEMIAADGGERDEGHDERVAANRFSGYALLEMQKKGICLDTLTLWSQLYRDLIDHLLDYQPLQSRLLWQQQYRYR
ncbi:DNA repair protein RecO [Psychrobacter pygoscelis]|uniref:DNA repair protein RecO n=1 Tax=Psychrobacter pygoscelis TaxID=2488563 RepID=UPI00103F0EAD|nr:DNA repair protein RecO C-terminal domain-containing protein [Psychrobacter pygoscelis]